MQKTICLNTAESAVFGNMLAGEIKVLVNAYDPDTGRMPGKLRMKALPALNSLYSKWSRTQNAVGCSGTGVMVDLEHPVACQIRATEREWRAAEKTLQRDVSIITKELSGYRQPYTGALFALYDSANKASDILRSVS